MNRVFARVSAWNAARYPQEYNHALSVSLLCEEYQEWLEARTAVDKLDALCDQIYVALGVLWKADVADGENEFAAMRANQTISTLVDAWELTPGYFVGSLLDTLEYEMDYPVAQAMHNIIQANIAQMMAMGLSFNQVVEALLIVCDANDSKSVKKTDPSVKANAGDKGPDFVSPEPRLAQLLEAVCPL